jgi:hypothetical protein
MFNWIIRYLVLNVKYIVDIFFNKIWPYKINFTDFKPFFSISPEETGRSGTGLSKSETRSVFKGLYDKILTKFYALFKEKFYIYG